MLMESLINFGARVLPVTASNASKFLASEDLSSIESMAIVGTWLRKESGPFSVDQCDFRVLKSPGDIIAAACVSSSSESSPRLRRH